jgi:hypothetical protein
MRAALKLWGLSLLAAILVIATGQAAPVVYHALQDTTPGMESTFTLDFGGGFIESSFISNTRFSLEVDPELGPLGSARFLSYSQQIASIDLPDPFGGPDPVPTGEITVEVLPGTSGLGAYNPLSGDFYTSETYRIHYTGDLSVYGLTEGFVDLPSSSTGTITLSAPDRGTIRQEWEGTYTFPGTEVSVNYTCAVNTQIVPEPGSFWLLALAAALGGRWWRRTEFNPFEPMD